MMSVNDFRFVKRVASVRQKQQGVAMLEVLIAFFVLSVGLMGLAALQVKAVQYNQGAYMRSQATLAAYDILDRMRLNRPAVSGNGYNITSFGGDPASNSGMVKEDVDAWKAVLAGNLPDGEGKIDCSSNLCTISIQWKDRFNAAADAVPELLEIQTQI